MHYDELEQINEHNEAYNLKATKSGRMSFTAPNISQKPSKEKFDPEYRYGQFIHKCYTLYAEGLMSNEDFKAACRPEPKPSKFSFLKVFTVKAQGSEEIYLWRLRIFETPWFGILLHKIMRPDPDRHMHDHPWPFFSFILRGAYAEQLVAEPAWNKTPCKFDYGRRWWNSKKADAGHKITILEFGKPVWTLVFRGKRCRTWGFHTEDGWIPWHIYLNAQEKQ